MTDTLRRSPVAAGSPERARPPRHRLARRPDLDARQRTASADSLPDIASLSSVLGDLPGLLQLTGGAARALARTRPADVAGLVRALADLGSRRRELSQRGHPSADEFGFDAELTEALAPAFQWIYRNWWRIQTRGTGNVPPEGPALLVANHAGSFPWDGAMVRTALFIDLPEPRHGRCLVHRRLAGSSSLARFMQRTGNLLADQETGERLLSRGELVIIFPEGARGLGKRYRDRYRLRPLGRGGFARLALRTGTPIIPVSIVGSEEIHPMLGNLRVVARRFHLPYFPITPTLPWLGPLGMVPLPSSWIIEFHRPIRVDHISPDDGDNPAVVAGLSEQVRQTIEEGVYANLERRGSVFAVP